jgi:hypothetical protein
MKDLPDIPANWYLKGAVWAVRAFRKNKQLRRVVAGIRDRCVLGTVSRLHVEAIHSIRAFSLNRDSLSDSTMTYEALLSLVNGCRNVMADLIESQPADIHCTIKLLGETAAEKKEEWPVYTIARSEPCDRPAEFGLDNAHLVGHNSTFAALSGANDRKNTWVPDVYSCFMCDDLAYHSNYDCSRENWPSYFRATAVFPLRYRRTAQRDHNVLGYLTFDTMDTALFSPFPCIFHNRTEKLEYERNLPFAAAYHVGGIIADTLACIFYPLLQNR